MGRPLKSATPIFDLLLWSKSAKVREGGSPDDRREARGSQNHGRGTQLRQRRRRRRRARDFYSALVQEEEKAARGRRHRPFRIVRGQFRPERETADARSGINSNGSGEELPRGVWL